MVTTDRKGDLLSETANVPLAAEKARAKHIPVLCAQVVDFARPLGARKGEMRILDATLGLGGHSQALLEACPNAELLGLDRDREALALAGARLAPFGLRVHTMHSRFSGCCAALDSLGWQGVDFALIDIGVSSMQLDEGVRGFSLHANGPLDMRMDQNDGPTAADLVNTLPFEKLREIIATLGEDPMAQRIAKAICEARARTPIRETLALADIVSMAYPKAWRAKSRHHPATRTFQALRMVVNNELGELETFMNSILARLNTGGRLAVITFHSLEDRLVKRTMRRWASGCLCPPHAPVCRCHHLPEVELLTKKPLVADREELARNPRASSAKLRACEKLAAPQNLLTTDERVREQEAQDQEL